MTQGQIPDGTRRADHRGRHPLSRGDGRFPLGHGHRPGHRGRRAGGPLHEPARLRPGSPPPGGRHALRRRAGMILSVEPIAAALEAIAAARGPSRRILLTPRGAPVRSGAGPRAGGRDAPDAHLRTLRRVRRAGHGRWSTRSCASATSCWPGGEVAAAVVIEAVARLVPGVLGCALSASEESFSRGAPRIPAVDPARRMERAGGSGGAALRRPRRDRPLAAAARPCR